MIESSWTRNILLAICSAIAGVALVTAGFKFTPLNWIVDGPGWLVNLVLPIDFHEGEGALGFFLAIFLAWLWTSAAAWIFLRVLWRTLARRR